MFYRRNLPHFLPNDEPYFVTFRLAGSLPRSAREKTTRDLDDRATQGTAPTASFAETDRLLDTGSFGPTWLRQPEIADIVMESILHRNQEQYDLLASTIMPNHVHMVFQLRRDLVLYEVLERLKIWTARECNKKLGRSGAFWQHESYDHVCREGELGRIIFYILNNPVKAKLCAKPRDWRWTYLSPDLHGFD